MMKEKLLEIIQGILNRDINLNYHLHLGKSELELPVAHLGDRFEQCGECCLGFTRLSYL